MPCRLAVKADTIATVGADAALAWAQPLEAVPYGEEEAESAARGGDACEPLCQPQILGHLWRHDGYRRACRTAKEANRCREVREGPLVDRRVADRAAALAYAPARPRVALRLLGRDHRVVPLELRRRQHARYLLPRDVSALRRGGAGDLEAVALADAYVEVLAPARRAKRVLVVAARAHLALRRQADEARVGRRRAGGAGGRGIRARRTGCSGGISAALAYGRARGSRG